MNNKTKISNLESYQELSIQIACLDMKLTKILELLNKPETSETEVVLKELSYEDWEIEFK